MGFSFFNRRLPKFCQCVYILSSITLLFIRPPIRLFFHLDSGCYLPDKHEKLHCVTENRAGSIQTMQSHTKYIGIKVFSLTPNKTPFLLGVGEKIDTPKYRDFLSADF